MVVQKVSDIAKYKIHSRPKILGCEMTEAKERGYSVTRYGALGHRALK